VKIPYGRQDITAADIEAVTAVLRSDFLTQGPAVPAFEAAVAAWAGAKHGVAVNSATAALHIACHALGVAKGDVVWTVPNTFVASANCARYCDADVDFVDIDARTWNMSVPALRTKLEHAVELGRLPKVVIPVHFAGQPTDQEEIWGLAKEFGFRVIEDASHSIGAVRDGERVGSCRWSDATVLSFHPVKIITTGEGGMVLTNDARLADRMAMLRSHGITRDPGKLMHDSPGGWYYEQQMLGFNYRMTDMQAALGVSQLARLETYVERRNYLAARYTQSLGGLPVKLPHVRDDNRSSFHLYVIRLDLARTVLDHRSMYDALRSRGIEVNLHYTPVHLQPYYRALGFREGQFPESEAHAEEAITLPLYPALTDESQDVVIRVLRELL
jgi:UDP-4-amino-4,6-dideoxy-N-acetyl-beta-L-altrosamine transaminase